MLAVEEVAAEQVAEGQVVVARRARKTSETLKARCFALREVTRSGRVQGAPLWEGESREAEMQPPQLPRAPRSPRGRVR